MLQECINEFMKGFNEASQLVAFVRNAQHLGAITIRYSAEDPRGSIPAIELLRVLSVEEGAIQELQEMPYDYRLKQELTSLLGKPTSFYRSNLDGGKDMTYDHKSEERFEPQA